MRILALALAAAVAGCAGAPAPAAKPPCPVIGFRHVETPQGMWFLLDGRNLEVLRLRLNLLHAGACDPGENYGRDLDADDRERELEQQQEKRQPS